jgi:serine/threonine-protein kinase
MGEVVEAVHLGLCKHVVVKLLHTASADDPRLADRLRVEAQVLASVSSPHLVTVSDIGRTPDGRPFFVMEYLQGATLRTVLTQRGPIRPHEAIEWTIQVLSGLAVAHRAGIVHRDIKLENVFLCDPVGDQPAIVKVLDFGIAKVIHAVGFDAPKYATEAGAVIGSPRYVSPEQVKHGTVDARTDIYGVGLLLYHLLTGHDPFSHHRDITDLLHAHWLETPKAPSLALPKTHLPYFPPELDHVILKALAKEPADRHQSAEAFVDALRHTLTRVPETTNRVLYIPKAPDAPTATGNGTAIIPLPSVPRLGNPPATPAVAPEDITSLDHAARPAQPQVLVYPDDVARRIQAFDVEPEHTVPMLAPASPSPSPELSEKRRLFLVVTAVSTLFFCLALLTLLRLSGVLG